MFGIFVPILPFVIYYSPKSGHISTTLVFLLYFNVSNFYWQKPDFNFEKLFSQHGGGHIKQHKTNWYE